MYAIRNYRADEVFMTKQEPGVNLVYFCCISLAVMAAATQLENIVFGKQVDVQF